MVLLVVALVAAGTVAGGGYATGRETLSARVSSLSTASAGTAAARRTPADLGILHALPDLGTNAASGHAVDPELDETFRLGLNAHVLWEYEPGETLEVLAESGIEWIRSDFDWALLEPAPGRYDWTSSDRLMRASAGFDIHVLALIDYSAPWASSDAGGDVHQPPANLDSYARFAAAVARRYGPGGEFWNANPELRAMPIEAVEIWNEPFGYWYWNPEPDPKMYAEMVRLASSAVKEANPEVLVLAAGDLLQYRSAGQMLWLEELLAADPALPTVIDGWTVHPYPDPVDAAPWEPARGFGYDVYGQIGDLLATLERHGAERPLWVTEIGWCTNSHPCGWVSDAEQAQYLEAFLHEVSTRWAESVEAVFVYSFARSTGDTGDREGNYGLRHPDGSFKPAMDSLEWIVEAWQTVPFPLGLVDRGTGIWRLAGDDGRVISFYYGIPGDYPMVGDWDCDGVDTPGLHRQSDGFVYLRNSNTDGVADVTFFFGNPGDIPIAGDFNGDGCDTVSIFRPVEGRVFITNELGSGDRGLGAAEAAYYFGVPGDAPFVGDFDGDGIDTIGLHREATGLVYFRNTHTQGIADVQFVFGDPGDRMLAGDWTADNLDTVGLFRPKRETFFLRFTNTRGSADGQVSWGDDEWVPVSGRFGT